MSAKSTFNPLSFRFHQDPYPAYARLRQRAPVRRYYDSWVVSTYADVRFVLSDALFSKESKTQQRPGLTSYANEMMLFRDPPAHRRLRRLAALAFAPGWLGTMRERIDAAAHELVTQAATRGPFDVISGVATRLPILVMTDLMQIPEHDRPWFGKTLADFRLIARDPFVTSAAIARSEAAALSIQSYLMALIRSRRSRPFDDLISRLVLARVGDDALTDHEIVATCLQLAAGYETTRNLIGNAVRALVRHPAALIALRAQRELVSDVVNEVIRWDSPAISASRIARADITIRGQDVRAGDAVVALIGAANRDGGRFVSPDRFDIYRPNKQHHLGFGYGIHFCIGAPLARLEVESVLLALIDTIDERRGLLEEPSYVPHLVLRGLSALHVRPR
jgi:cytochrome P450